MNDFQNSVIKGISRGGLLYPTKDIVDVVLVSYLVIRKLSENELFYRATLQRKLCVDTTLTFLDSEEMLQCTETEFCSKHKYVELIHKVVWVCSNTILNKLCFQKNDEVISERLAKRHKLKTLC